MQNTADGQEAEGAPDAEDEEDVEIGSYLPWDSDSTLRAHAVTGPDFRFYGPRRGIVNDGQGTGTYFDVPIDDLPFFPIAWIEMQWDWKDQGWGNRSSEIWLTLMRNGTKVDDARCVWGGVCVCV